jgi:hypothetical protein
MRQHEFEQRLAELVGAGMTAGLSASQLEGALQIAINGLRARMAAGLNLSTTPKMHDGYGRPRV